MVTTKLNLSMTEPQVRQIYAKQGDTGRVLDIALDQTPEDGTLRILRPDGVEVTSDASLGEDITESGEVVSFDALDEAPLTSLKVGIEPIQDLNGYDAPWVGGAGKNKLPKGTNRDSKGITYAVNDDGSVLITGTASATSFWGVQFTLSAGTYTLSGCPSGGGNNSYLIDIRNAVGGSGISGISGDSGKGSTFTLTASLTAYCNIRVANGYAVPTGGILLKPQIEVGQTATTFAPYSNICPITGHDEVTVTDVGKNRALFSNESNPNRFAFDYTTETAQKISGTCTAGGGRFIGKYIVHLKANTNYKAVGSASWGSGVIYIYSDELWGTIVAPNVQFGNSFSVSNEGDYVVGAYVGVATVGTTYTLTDFMIVLASETDTTWTPYQSNTYTTSLGQTVYGGTLDMASGVLTVDKAMVDLGTLTWLKEYTRFYAPLAGAQVADTDHETAICTAYSLVRAGETSVRKQGFTIASNGNIYIYDGTQESATASQFKTAMNGVTCVYSLTNPTTYQLTAQQTKTLVGTNNVWASSGDIISIKFTYGGLLSELPSDATSIVGKCYCDVEQNGVSSMPFTLNVKKNERAT